jgi:hypothetical protein
MNEFRTLMGILNGVPSKKGSVFFARSTNPFLSVSMYPGIFNCTTADGPEITFESRAVGCATLTSVHKKDQIL